MDKRKLFSVSIKDCEVQTFRCGGHGGQNVNKVESGVRVIHAPSRAVGQSCDTRDQFRNKRLAFERMAGSRAFQVWARLEAGRVLGHKPIEEIVEELMNPANIKTEYRNSEGRWEQEKC